MNIKIAVVGAILSVAPSLLYGQFDFSLAGKKVQTHSFGSQGFAYSDDNNYLTMKTSSGSSAFTDVGFNMSTSLTEKFRVGAQVYDRNIGSLGNWHPVLDWAVADYRVNDWFGIRAGKVKTVLGLVNDTQDMEFLHTWAVLPQSTYPLDFRGEYISHLGGDAYGSVPIKKAGSLAYTVWVGQTSGDSEGGMRLALLNYPAGKIVQNGWQGGLAKGVDLRWIAPLKGLTLGASLVGLGYTVTGLYTIKPYNITADLNLSTKKSNTQAYYAEYAIGNLRLDGEYRKNWEVRKSQITGPIAVTRETSADSHYGYVSAAYRLAKWIEVGTYHSRYYPNWGAVHGSSSGHMFDTAATARFDLRSYLDLKVEGHFMDGYGDAAAARTFYPSDNPSGLKPRTNMLVVRLGFSM